MPKVWRDGVQVDGSLEDFTRQLRRLSGWAEERFCIMSDQSALVGDILNQAADEIDRLSKLANVK